MTQFKMQMPGGRGRRSAGPDVYTALAFAAVAFLIAACVIMWQAAMKVAPTDSGHPFVMQEAGQIKLASPK